MNKYPAALLMTVNLVVAGCSRQTPEEVFQETTDEVNATGTMTGEHMAYFRKLLRDNKSWIRLDGLTSITDERVQTQSREDGRVLLPTGRKASRRAVIGPCNWEIYRAVPGGTRL